MIFYLIYKKTNSNCYGIINYKQSKALILNIHFSSYNNKKKFNKFRIRLNHLDCSFYHNIEAINLEFLLLFSKEVLY